MSFRRMTTALSALVTICAITTTVAADPSISIVAMDNDLIPDGTEAFEFNSNWTVLSDSGEVTFVAVFSGPFGTNGVYRGLTNRLIEGARSGQTDSAGDTLWKIYVGDQPAANAKGRAAFHALTTDQQSQLDIDAIYLGDGCDLIRVVADGDAAPGNGQVFPWRIHPVNVNAVDQVAFSAYIGNTAQGSEDDEALYRWNGVGNPLVEIVRKGNAPPIGTGTITGTTLQSWQAFASPGLNNAGEVAFLAGIEDSGVHNDAGIYRGEGGPLTQIARIGHNAPGGGEYFRFCAASTVPINNAGQVAFCAALETGAVGGEPNGVFLSDGETTTQIVRGGMPIPDGDGDFRLIDRHVDLNDNGLVAFASSITDLTFPFSNAGLFIGDGDSLTVIAREGQPCPDELGVFRSFDGFSVNNAGQVAFRAGLDIDLDNVTPVEEYGIFLFDPNTGLHVVVREGMPLLDTTIYDLGFAGTSASNGSIPHSRSGLNNLGEVAFSFQLADHHGAEGVAVWALDRAPQDVDGDLDVDRADAALLIECMSGPGTPLNPCCLASDIDRDGYVDLMDYGSLMIAIEGL